MASNSIEGLEVTKDEAESLKTAFKDEKFIQLFSEYAEEVTNPENRKQYEEELIAYEKQCGNQVTFIHPEAGYVLKTSVQGEEKAFINICTNNNVEGPSPTQSDKGIEWKVPHLLTPPREDLDKSGARCTVYDVIFHPLALQMARKDQRFRKMINDFAIDAVENKFDVTLDRKNIHFPKMKYKGYPVAPVTRKPTGVPDNENDDLDPELKETLKPPKSIYTNNKPGKKERRRSTKPHSKDETLPTSPKYSIKYRNHIDIQDFTNIPCHTVNTRPHEIIIEINLPLLNSASDLNLDIFEKRLLLISEKKGANYRLDLSLPYPVDENEGKAQFDKVKRKLVVTLKVLVHNNCVDSHINERISEDDNSDMTCIYSSNAGNVHDMKDLHNMELSDHSLETNTDSAKEIELFEPVEDQLTEISSTITTVQDISELNDITERIEGNLHVSENESSESKKPDLLSVKTNLDAINETAKNEIQEEIHNCNINIPFSTTVAFSLPKFDYYQTTKILTLVIQVKNIDPSSICTYLCSCSKNYQITFYTLGAGFVPFYYRLHLKFKHYLDLNSEHTRISLSKDNLVVHLMKGSNFYDSWTEFEAGLDENSLQKFEFVCKEAIMKTIKELKDESEIVLSGDALTSEQVHVENVSLEQVTFDIKLNQSKQDEETEITEDQDINHSEESKTDSIQDVIPSLKVSTKCRTSSGSSEDQSPIEKKRGILKYPRYWRTISESSDDTFWSSLDNECITPIGSLESTGEKPKKCVRFSDQIAKNVFRANSSILGQRKKNQRKARNRKKTTNKMTDSDNQTETSEEVSDYNSTSEMEGESSPVDIPNPVKKLYAWKETKDSADSPIKSETEPKFQTSEDKFSNTEDVLCSDSCINDNNQYSSLIMELSVPACESDDNTDFTPARSSQCFSPNINKNQKITIMQRPASLALNNQKSEKSKSSITNSDSNLYSSKSSDKKNNNELSQKLENKNGNSKQKNKWRRKRKWRNKKNNHYASANSNENPADKSSNYILQGSLQNHISKRGIVQNSNMIYGDRQIWQYGNPSNFLNASYANTELKNTSVDYPYHDTSHCGLWWNDPVQTNPQYRTRCMVNFSNQVMFQLD